MTKRPCLRLGVAFVRFLFKWGQCSRIEWGAQGLGNDCSECGKGDGEWRVEEAIGGEKRPESGKGEMAGKAFVMGAETFYGQNPALRRIPRTFH